MAGDKNTSIEKLGLRSVITVKGISYDINSAVVPQKFPLIMTNAFLNETVVDTIKASLLVKEEIKEDHVEEVMKQQHESMKQLLRLKHAATDLSQGEYMGKMRKYISENKLKDALSLNEDALAVYPHNPFFMSYLGYLKAAVLKENKTGLDICKRAMEKYQTQAEKKEGSYLSYFSLNIGRVYLLSGKKDFAINSYLKGLQCDPRNKEIIEELAKLGIRRPAPIPFLGRSNPINKYLGIFLSRLGIR